MKNLRIILTAAIFLAVTIFIGSAIRSYYLFLKEPVLPAVHALPENTTIIISSKSVFKLFESVNNSALVDLLQSDVNSYELINSFLDSINLQSTKFSKLLSSNEVLFALIPEGDRNKLLFACSVGKVSSSTVTREIKNLINSDSCTVKKEVNNTYKVICADYTFWYYVKKGVLAVSADSILIDESIGKLNANENSGIDTSLLKLTEAIGKRVDGNIIINTARLAEVIWPEMAGKLKGNTPFGKWISFDLNIRKNSVMLGGFTISESDHIFEGQEPVEYTAFNHLPQNSALALTLSLSDVTRYSKHFLKADTLHVTGFDPSLKDNTNEIFRANDHLRSWIGNSISHVYTTNYFRSDKSAQLIMIECRDSDSASFYLRPFIDPHTDSTGRLLYTSFTRDLFGEAFALNGPLWCLISDNYVYISPAKGLLPHEGYRSMKGLDIINENIGNTSTVSVLMRPQVISGWLKQHQKNANKQLLSFMGRQNSAGFQYSAGGSNGLEYTHAWIYPNVKSKPLFASASYKQTKPSGIRLSVEKMNKSVSTEQPADANPTDDNPDLIADDAVKSESNNREVKLKASPSSLQIVSAAKRNSKNITVITAEGELLVYDHSGYKLWSFKPKEPLESGVHEIDQNRDGKPEYLVVSKNYLYILNSEGKAGQKAIRLPKSVSGAVSVFDYDNNRDYRILYSGSDKRIYNITVKGVELPDWQKPVVEGAGVIKHFRTNGRDYLIYKSESQTKIFDRRGRERIKISHDLNLSENTSIFENKTNSKGIFIGASKDGDLIYINESGIISKTTFAEFSTNPSFNYYDFDSDGSMDFIFTDKDKIMVFNRMKKVITSRKADGADLSPPFLYSSSSKSHWIFVRDRKSNEILSLHNSGKSLVNKTIKSETDPVVFNPGGSLEEVLVTTKKGKLILTPLNNL